jgi:hypothetical protein
MGTFADDLKDRKDSDARAKLREAIRELGIEEVLACVERAAPDLVRRSEAGTQVVVDPYDLPIASKREVAAMETQKPFNAKETLDEVIRFANDARYAMQEAASILLTANVHPAAQKLREAHDKLVKQLQDVRSTMGPKVHVLKADPGPFRMMWNGLKPFEVRKFDRDFRVGDELKLLEHDRTVQRGVYSGAKIRAKITSMVLPGEYGLPDDIGVLGLEILEKKEH